MNATDAALVQCMDDQGDEAATKQAGEYRDRCLKRSRPARAFMHAGFKLSHRLPNATLIVRKAFVLLAEISNLLAFEFGDFVAD